MEYKDYQYENKAQHFFPDMCIDQSLECFQVTKEYSYSQKEWIDKISFFMNEINQKKYDVIYQIFEYVFPCTSQIPYQLFYESHLFDCLVTYFNQSVYNLYQDKKIESILQISEEKKKIVKDNNILLCVFIFDKLFQTDALLGSTSINDNFFISIIKLCFSRNKFFKIIELSLKDLSVCIEALKFVKQLFEISQKVMIYFEEQFNFTFYLHQQYYKAKVIEIKYDSLSVFLPWMSIYPGNRRTFELFVSEMEKTIGKQNQEITNCQTIKNYYSKKNGKFNEYVFAENQIFIISLLFEGILRFLQFKGEEYDVMSQETQMKILNFSIYGINTNHELTEFYGLKILNIFLKEKIIDEKSFELVLMRIREKIPILLNTSKDICHESVKMIKYLLHLRPELETILFDEQFTHYFLSVLDDKEYEWKKIIIKFIGHIMNMLTFPSIQNLLNVVNVVDIISEINDVGDDKILDLLFSGIFRIMSNDNNGKTALLNQDIENVLSEFIDNPTFAPKAQVLLNLINSDQ